jgi:hypothetical protein
LCSEIYSNFSSIYDESSPYWPLIREIIVVYEESEKLYDNLAEKVVEIEKIGSAWDFQYKDALIKISKREELRRVYDHYDQKMQKLNKKREDKIAKGEIEGEKEIELYQRVSLNYH